jgi:peroxiredoxin
MSRSAPVTPTAAASVSEQHAAAPTADADAAPTDETTLVARVNDQELDRSQLEQTLAADRAMAALFGQPLPDESTALDRLVNGELVWQAAQASGFTLTADEVSQALEDFLTANGKSLAELETVLDGSEVSFEAFMAYYARLLTVDRFSQARAQGQGISVPDYLQRLQQQARIDIAEGAPSQEAAPSLAVAPVTPTPVPEPSSVSPTDLPRGTAPGQVAPAAVLPVLGADTRISLDDLRGKPVLLSFWSYACGHCRTQTPVLVEAYTRYAERVQFVGISTLAMPDEVAAYVAEQGIQYPVLLDEAGAAVASYGITGVPTTFFLDAEGRVVASRVGALSAEEIETYLAQLLVDAAP